MIPMETFLWLAEALVFFGVASWISKGPLPFPSRTAIRLTALSMVGASLVFPSCLCTDLWDRLLFSLLGAVAVNALLFAVAWAIEQVLAKR